MKELTEEQALAKAAALCSSSEKCTGQILTKLAAWGMDTAQSEHIIQRLQAEKFIDDSRFCRAYCADKMRYNHWGRIKIRQALRMLGLEGDDIEQGLDSIDRQEYEQVLADVIARKAKSLHEADSYTLRQKLLRHAYSHGFEPELIFRLIPDSED